MRRDEISPFGALLFTAWRTKQTTNLRRYVWQVLICKNKILISLGFFVFCFFSSFCLFSLKHVDPRELNLSFPNNWKLNNWKLPKSFIGTETNTFYDDNTWVGPIWYSGWEEEWKCRCTRVDPHKITEKNVKLIAKVSNNLLTKYFIQINLLYGWCKVFPEFFMVLFYLYSFTASLFRCRSHSLIFYKVDANVFSIFGNNFFIHLNNFIVALFRYQSIFAGFRRPSRKSFQIFSQ